MTELTDAGGAEVVHGEEAASEVAGERGLASTTMNFDPDDEDDDPEGSKGLFGKARSLLFGKADWSYEEGPEGGDRWVNDSGDVRYRKPVGADPAPDDEPADGGDDEDEGDSEAAGIPINGAGEFDDRQMEAAVQMAEMADELDIEITEISTTDDLPEDKQQAMACYYDENRSLHINPDKFDEETIQEWHDDVPTAQIADPRMEHTVAHEVMHALDHQTGEGLAPVQYDDRETEADEIKRDLGKQAWFSPREMVAEVGAFKLLGEEPPSEKAAELFEKYSDGVER